MAIYKNTPPIVTSGLVLNLDSLNPQSIPLDPTVNLALWSQDFSQSVWGKSIYDTITTGSIAPDGTPTAALIDETSASLAPAVFAQGNIRATSSTITYSIYTKKGTATSRSFLLRNNTTLTNFTGFNFLYSISSSAVGWTVQDAGNDWFRLSYTQTTGITPGDILQIYAGRTGAAAAGSTATWYLWGAQVEATSYATPYIISTATNGRRTTWQDLSGNNRTTTLLSSSISGSIPVFASSTERALNFNGASSYAETTAILTGSSYTSEFFFNANSVPLTVEKWLGSQYNFGANRIIFNIFTDNRLRNFMGGGTNPSSTSVFSTTVVQPNRWYHAVFSKDTLGTGSLYVNGVLEGRGAMSLGTPENVPFQIGGDTALPVWFNGKIPITRLYNRELSQAEVTQNYNAIKSRFGL
jgi:hypothetical protein